MGSRLNSICSHRHNNKPKTIKIVNLPIKCKTIKSYSKLISNIFKVEKTHFLIKVINIDLLIKIN